MKKRQWKKLKKKVRIGLEKGEAYLNWREKNFLGLILYTDLRHEITKEIDNHIIAQIRELAEVQPIPDMDLTKIFPEIGTMRIQSIHEGDPDYEKTINSDEEDS